MATAALRRAMTAFTRPPDPSDADLLRQFADSRCESAFAALVRRHGPLVLGVCRRVVPDRHLADDAFQAAFVVLSRRAGGIDPNRPLGPWLYGVAHRVALRARTMLGKRRERETLTAAVPEMLTSAPVVDDSAAVLDEEIANLPPASRDAVILCELQGLSRREAAAKMGVAEGTLSSRLAAARKTLAAKLQARGVVLSAALAGAAVVSPQLATAAVSAGTGVSLSSVVVSLADGASAMTLLNKLKLTAVAVLFLLLSAGGVGPWRANETSAAPVPKPKPKPDAGLLWVLNDITFELKAFSPDGRLVKEFKLPEGNRYLGLTPNGQQIAFAGKGGKVADPKETAGLTVHLRDVGGGTQGTDTGLECQPSQYLVWSPDGSKVISVGASAMYDLATRKRTELKLPADHQCWQWAPDGSWLLVRSGDDVKPPNWFKYTLADGKLTPIATNFPCYRVDVSPDGRHLIGYAHRISMPEGVWREDRALVRVEVASGKETPLAEFAEPTGYGYGWARWSPDGKRLAFWCSVRKTVDDPDDMQLSVCDADTGERKTIATLPFNPWVLQGWYPAQKIKAPVPKPKDPEPLVAVWQGDDVRVLSADGTEQHKLSLDAWKGQRGFVRLSPDGKRVAVRVAEAKVNRLVVVTLGKDQPDLDVELGDGGGGLFWHPDGRSLGLDVGDDLVTADAATGRTAAAKRPGGVSVRGVTADGRYLADHNAGDGKWRAGFVDAKLGKFEPLKLRGEPTEMHFDMAAGVSADGGVVTVARVLLDDTAPFKQTVLAVVDVKTGEATCPLSAPELAFGSERLALSADGELAAVAYKQPLDATGGGPAPDRFALAVYRRSTGKLTELAADLKGVHAVDVWSPQKIKAPVPKEKPTGELIWTHNTKTGKLIAYTPDGEAAKTLTLKDGEHFLGLTPVGQKIAFAGKKGKLPVPGAADGLTLHLRPVSDAPDGTDTGLSLAPGDTVHWSPDGTRVVRVRAGPQDKNGGLTYEHVQFDLATKKETKVELPVNHYVVGWAADGKTWLLHEYVRADLRDPKLPRYRMMAVPAGGGKPPVPLCDGASLLGLEPADDKSFHAFGHAHTNPADENQDATYRRWFRVSDTGQATLVKTFTGFDSGELRSSPDRKKVVCLLRTTGDDASDSVLTLYNPDASNEKKLFTLTKDGQYTHLLGWFPVPVPPADPKAKPPGKEPIKAPVPKAKENTMGLTASVTPEKAEFLLGEPVFLTFTVTNPTDTPWQFEEGGDYRNRLGRPNSFTVTVTGPDGKAVSQPDSGHDLGGMSVMLKLPANGKATFQRALFLPHWATIDKPGEYAITVTRKVGLVPADTEDPFRAKATPVTLTAVVKVTVQPADAKKLGELIDEWAKAMLDPNSSTTDPATQRLQEIQDERVIPHFVELGKRPGWSPRHTACGVLKRFKTDEAFAALKVMAATTADDLTASGKRQQDEANAASARGSAVSALAACGHPDALAEVWKAADDSSDSVRMTVLHKAFEVKSAEARKVIEKLTEDADERVRTEAKRYADLLAKEKK